MGNRGWTKAEDRQLLALRAAGRTISEVARLLSRTPEAVRSREQRLRNGRAP